MYMTDDEIRGSYERAENKSKQVQVLAELNAASRKEMVDKLAELGIAAEPRRGRTWHKGAKLDERRAQELWEEGLCDGDIAERCGVAKSTISVWRRKNGLPYNCKKKAQEGVDDQKEGMEKGTATEGEDDRMSAWALLQIMKRVEEAYTGQEVKISTTGEGDVRDVMVSTTYNANAEVDSVEVRLYAR